MTTKDVLALALEALVIADNMQKFGKAYSCEALLEGDAKIQAAITAIKQAQEPKVKLIPTAEEMGTPMQPQAITPETGNAANPLASAITAGNGQAQEPVKAIHQVYMGDGWKDKPASEMWMYTPEQGWESKYVRTVYTHPAPKQAEPASCRIELVVAIHTLASHYENRLGRLDPEDRKLAEGDIAHAMKIAAKWNWNGTSPTPPEAA